MSSPPLRVIARVRPLTGNASVPWLSPDSNSSSSLISTLLEKNKLVRSNVRGEAPRLTTFLSTRVFDFDAAFYMERTTADVYVSEISPLIERVMSGASCCVLAYGATGSGKTHTMTGSPNAADGMGFLHMAALELCEMIERVNSEENTNVLTIYVTGGEIYQEELLDLGMPGVGVKPKRMSTTTLRRVLVPTATAGELVAVVEAFVSRRAAGATNKNEHSSRSHAIFQIHVEERGETFGTLALVDLAGAEYCAATEGRDDIRRLEGGKNNLGLMSLKACFRHVGAEAAAAKTTPGVTHAAVTPTPFSWHRSKLTAALRPFFTDVAGQMVMLITASPDEADAMQTAHALEEGVVVAGRCLREKKIRELEPPQIKTSQALRAGSGNGGGGGGGLRGGKVSGIGGGGGKKIIGGGGGI